MFHVVVQLKNHCDSRKKPSSNTSCKKADCYKYPGCYACHNYDCGDDYTRSEKHCWWNGWLAGCYYTCKHDDA